MNPKFQPEFNRLCDVLTDLKGQFEPHGQRAEPAPTPGRFVYLTCCVDLTDGAEIQEMTDRAREITFKTFAQRCDWKAWARDHSYDIGSTRGLHLKDDWHVRYYKSRFRGVPCYYIVHSAIEYIFVAPVRNGSVSRDQPARPIKHEEEATR